MDVNFNIGQTNLMNFSRINQSIAARSIYNSSNRLSKTEHTDRISISPQGKKNSLLDNLMKQKMNITEQKNSLVHSTLEKGGTLDGIQSQIANYDEQIKTIDDQITKLTAKELKKQIEKVKNQKNSKPKTEEEIQKERLSAVVNLAQNLQQTKTIRSVQSKVNGEARVLKSEIELDHMHSGSSPGAAEMIAKKEERLASLEQKSMSLSSEVSNRLSDADDKKIDLHQPQETLPNNRKGESEMNIGGIGNQAKPYAPQKSQGSESVDSLNMQREALKKQLEAVKSRPKHSQAEQDAAIAQKQALEKQISTIDQKIQKASQNKGQSSLQSSLPVLQAKPPSLQTANLDSGSDRKSAVKAPSAKKSADQIPSWMKDTGRLLDRYA